MTMLAANQVAKKRSELDRLADERVQELTDMGPEGRLHELSKMLVGVERIAPAIQAATWATGEAKKAIELGGELRGDEGDCDCIYVASGPIEPADLPGILTLWSQSRMCREAVVQVGGLQPTYPAKHPMLKSALIHAQIIEKLLRDSLNTFKKQTINHGIASKILKSAGL